MCPSFISLLLTDKIRICLSERSRLKNIRKLCISYYSKVVHNIKLPFAYSEFTVHMQNRLLAGSFVRIKVGSYTCYEMNDLR